MLQRPLWLALTLLLFVGNIRPSYVDARIVVGVSTVNVAFLPIYLTQDKGFFKDEGLDVLVVMFNAGATNLDRKSTRLNSSHIQKSRMPSSA